MKFPCVVLLSMLVAPAVGAATIADVSGQTGALVQTGETLAFEILTGSFAKNAVSFGLPLDPTEITFALVSVPLPDAGSFSASLQSADGSVSVDFGGPLIFHDGTFSGSGYQGAVSTLQGSLQLSAQLSQELFRDGPVVLLLRNQGPDLEIGLDPYTLRQDLYVSLAGGPLSVGGIVSSANLESAEGVKSRGNPLNLVSTDTPDFLGSSLGSNLNSRVNSLSVAPEPGSSLLLLGGGTFLCCLSLAMSRISKRRK